MNSNKRKTRGFELEDEADDGGKENLAVGRQYLWGGFKKREEAAEVLQILRSLLTMIDVEWRERAKSLTASRDSRSTDWRKPHKPVIKE